MLRHAIVLGGLVLGVARDPGCSTDSTASGANAPCTRDRDCVSGTCERGVCVVTSADAAADDAGPDGDAHDDGAVDAGGQ